MFKTILVHVDGGAHQESRLHAAVLLAGAHGGHLVGSAATGLSMAGYAVLNGSMAMPVSHRGCQDLRDTAGAALAAFLDQAARLGAPAPETRLVEDSARGGLRLQSRHADLVVLSQDDGAHALTDEQPGLHGDEPGADMALHLARHGVPVEVAVERTRAPESDALIDMARDCRAGLLVAGAFGHGRYREWVLGGVTRDMFDHAPAPLLTMH